MNGFNELQSVLNGTGPKVQKPSVEPEIETGSLEGSLDFFIDKFGGWTESYMFYDGTVELRYDPKEHVYLLVSGEDLVVQPGVSTVSHIIDKSEILLPWACKMMAEKIFKTIPVSSLPTGEQFIRLSNIEFMRLVNEAKKAHREKLEEAGDIGTMAHNWIENHIRFELGLVDSIRPMPEEIRANNCCVAALDWMKKHNVRWKCTERKIYSKKHGFAGTMDGLCLVDSCDNPLCCPTTFTDRLSIADWKSSNFLYTEYLYQTAAYQLAYIEEMNEPVEDRWIIRLGKTDGEFEAWHEELDTFEEDVDAFLTCLVLHKAKEVIEERMKVKIGKIKDARRIEKIAEREASLKIKCKSADKYKGVRIPTCNNGNPCQTCMRTYIEKNKEKL